MQYNTIQYNTIEYSAVQYHATQLGQHSTRQCKNVISREDILGLKRGGEFLRSLAEQKRSHRKNSQSTCRAERAPSGAADATGTVTPESASRAESTFRCHRDCHSQSAIRAESTFTCHSDCHSQLASRAESSFTCSRCHRDCHSPSRPVQLQRTLLHQLIFDTRAQIHGLTGLQD